MNRTESIEKKARVLLGHPVFAKNADPMEEMIPLKQAMNAVIGCLEETRREEFQKLLENDEQFIIGTTDGIW